MWTLIHATNRKLDGTADGTDTEIRSCLTYKWRVRINRDGLYNKKESAPKRGWEKWPRNESLPAHLHEKYSRGDDHLTLYERPEKPTTYRSRPSLSNPRSTNDIVRAVLRANLTLLRSATNRVLTNIIFNKDIWVNLYKLHFLSSYFSFQSNKKVFHPSTFPSFQPNTNKEN